MLCIMKAEANYTTELTWTGVRNALQTGQVLGWITKDEVSTYYDFMERHTLEKLQKQDGGIPEDANPKLVVHEFLTSNLIQRPRQVMAMLSKLGIMEVHPMWIHLL
mmetsp:Transcript_84829/g.147806  ORF Transcript_84829/g.147806 Transcript_84829/m.147806 type:complete len:106 (+) Transcript_84829:37-354(+)